MFNPGAPSQILASAHSLSTNCAHGNYAATCLVGNLPSPTWRQPCGPLLLLLKSNQFLALTLYLIPAPNPPCVIGAVCPSDSDKALGLLCWKCFFIPIFIFCFFLLLPVNFLLPNSHFPLSLLYLLCVPLPKSWHPFDDSIFSPPSNLPHLFRITSFLRLPKYFLCNHIHWQISSFFHLPLSNPFLKRDVRIKMDFS